MSKKVIISKSFLEDCIQKRLTGEQVAILSNCSSTTVYRAAWEYGLSLKGSKRTNERWSDTRHRVFYYYRSNARKAKREFLFTEDEFFQLIIQPCTYCGRVNTATCEVKDYWSVSKDRATFQYTGIDRVDSSKDYTLENCVPCCVICNHAKREMNLEAFKEWIQAIVEFNSVLV